MLEQRYLLNNRQSLPDRQTSLDEEKTPPIAEKNIDIQPFPENEHTSLQLISEEVIDISENEKENEKYRRGSYTKFINDYDFAVDEQFRGRAQRETPNYIHIQGEIF